MAPTSPQLDRMGDTQPTSYIQCFSKPLAERNAMAEPTPRDTLLDHAYEIADKYGLAALSVDVYKRQLIRLKPMESTTVPVTIDGKNLRSGFKKKPRTARCV